MSEEQPQTLRDAPSSPVAQLGRFLVAVAWRFHKDECLTRASALAYVTLLSLVPFLALMFAILKGLGVQRRLEPLLLSRFALDTDTVERIIGYIDQTNVGTLGTLGAATLILTVVSVLGSVEGSLNYIWRVRRGRSYWRMLTDYSSVVLLTPLLLLAAVAITSTLQQQSLLQWILQNQYVGAAALQALRLLPIFINIVALAVLYAVMPYRTPYWPGIILGAAIAGCLWHAVQWAYVAFQFGMARYNAIYGALSQLPITLVWLYLSAAIVLAGAELAATYEFGIGATRTATQPSPWLMGVHLLVRAAERFRGTDGPIDVGSVTEELGLEPDTVLRVAEDLRNLGLLAPVADRPGTFVLARDPTTIDLGALDDLADGAALPGCDSRVAALEKQLDAQRRSAQAALRLSDVLAIAPNAGSGSLPPR